MRGPGDQPGDPPPAAVYREAVYDDEGRFAPAHGVLGLPSWITDPRPLFDDRRALMLDTLPQYCLDCDVRFACNGGCPKDRFDTTPDGEPGLHHLCAGYKAFFGHVDAPMRFMAERLRAGQDATALRDWYAAADAQRGRNDPCTCGSGRKFKRCHGAPTSVASST